MLALPATPAQVLAQIIVPGLTLLPAELDTPVARVQLLAIAGQESGLRTRQQDGGGPAHGLWQCESPVLGLLLANPVSANLIRITCRTRAVAPIASDMYLALLNDDPFACAIARLILLCDPHPLPDVGDVDDAWVCYQKNWGPGKPRPQDWPANYAAALAATTGTSP
jgi:hypothetical protein